MKGLAGFKSDVSTTTATAETADVAPSEVGDRPLHHVVSRSVVGRKKLRFESPWDTWKSGELLQLLKWQRQRSSVKVDLNGWLSWSGRPSKAEIAEAFPIEALDSAALSSPPADAVQATWAGHSTLLVQMDGVAFLTDPVFSERCSPSQLLGPRRVTPPAFRADSDVPAPDFVLISHSHYDHLDAGSVDALNRRHGAALTWYVPLGLARWFRDRGVASVVELDWWQSAEHPVVGHRGGGGRGANAGIPGRVMRSAATPSEDARRPAGAGVDAAARPPSDVPAMVRVVMTPAQHWSSRTPFDRNASLWGGWAVLGRTSRFWFAGDTGYCPVFKEIGERLGPFDLAAIPIGAYAPRWFLKPQHINPEEAVRIHREVRAHTSVAIHHGTFCLADESLDEPAARLEHARLAAGLEEGAFTAPRHGITIVAGRERTRTPHLTSPVVPEGVACLGSNDTGAAVAAAV